MGAGEGALMGDGNTSLGSSMEVPCITPKQHSFPEAEATDCPCMGFSSKLSTRGEIVCGQNYPGKSLVARIQVLGSSKAKSLLFTGGFSFPQAVEAKV